MRCAQWLLGGGLLGMATSLHAQAAPEPAGAPLYDPAPDDAGVIIVTAQKRSENIQNVPLSITAFDTESLSERSVQSFNDYAKFLPSLSYSTYGPGQAEVFFRGISNGNRLSTGSLPSVGVYLDEQPVTTIGSALDVHIYDIARVEALAGPQGTLFGASSEAGTLRIITNKPDPSGTYGGIDLTLNQVAHGGIGGSLEGFVNLPLADRVALRMSGFRQHEGGYIDNVPGEPGQIFPTSGIARDNSALLGEDLNDIDTHGARAALGIDLDDSWTVTPSIIYQQQSADGTFAYRRRLGDLVNARYGPDSSFDRWYQAALVIEGKIGRFDLTYAGGYLERTAEYTSDYSDYAYFYDSYYVSTPEYFGAQFFNNAGDLIDPSQVVTQEENFTKQSHELRIASPSSDRLRLVAGLFHQRQTNDWTNLYIVEGLADSQSVTGRPGVNYANIQFRTDRDYAAFTEAAFDIVPELTLTAGARIYRYDNDVTGFFGYNADRSAVGEALCLPGTTGIYGADRPCDNIDAAAKGSGLRHKLSLSWRPSPGKLLYATWSTGFRPGGINRRPTAAPYEAEQLANYEFGWKTSWLGGIVRINGALFLEKLTQAQFAVTSDQNGITDIVNSGRAESKGVEADLTLLPAPGLSLQWSGTYVDAALSTNLCQYANPQFDCSIPSPSGNENSTTAPAGTKFPATPAFKMSGTARYEFPLGSVDAHVQGSVFHQSSVSPSLSVTEAELLRRQPGYTTADFVLGGSIEDWSFDLALENAFDARGQQLRGSSCNIELCGNRSIQIVPIRPRLISLRLARRF
jgi:iron complex outermembrane recepter protein